MSTYSNSEGIVSLRGRGKDSIELSSDTRGALESVLDAIELSGRAEVSGDGPSGLELLSAARETLPRSNAERYAGIVVEDGLFRLTLARGDVSLWLGFEVLNYV